MKDRTLAVEAKNKVGEKVTLYGWVQIKRDHGKITFFDLWDRSGLIQVVGMGESAAALKPQYVVKVEGTVQKRPENMINNKLETGEIEVKTEKIEVLAASEELPFDMGMQQLDLEL